MNKFVLDISAIQNNITKIKNNLKPNTKFCAMVKANAYGHGIKVIAKNISSIVDFFGVASVSEALVLRRSNISNKILVVGAFESNRARLAVIHDISVAVSSLQDLIVVDKVARRLGMLAKVHIKINTGMNRLGTSSKQEFEKMLNFLQTTTYIKLEGVFSHFCCSDSDAKFTTKQNKVFKSFIKGLKDKRVIKHISSSYAAVNYKKYNYDMVRVGIGMYGYTKGITLKPAITIYSNIAAVHKIAKNNIIGYDKTFVADKDMIIATVPVGYADGLNLKLSNKLYVYINNKPCKIVGKICMDMFMCDITNVSAKVGDVVTIMDRYNNATVFKTYCDNSEYEVLTNFKTSRMRVVIKK